MSVDNSIVTLDDTDPQLQWSGPWFTTENNVDDPDSSGPPFLNTLHGISGSGSLVFSFYGKIVGIWGSLRPRNTSLGPDPNWQCVLDGQDIGQSGYPDVPASNYRLCGAGPLLEGHHTLQLNTIIQSEPLHVDQVQYQAAATVDIGSAWTQVDQRDGRFNYSLGWEQIDLLKWTYTPGAWLTFDFVGTGVIWGGYTPNNPGVGTGLGQYLVDNQVAPTNFSIPSRSASFYNQPYFNISGLKPGPHRLQVTNAGNTNTAALGLTYIYLKNSPTNTPIPNGNIGEVIGGAVGGSIGAIIIIILSIVVFFWRRRRRNQQQAQEAASVGGTTQGRRVSMMSGSTTLKEQLTPGSLTQGTWGLYPNIPHIPPIVPSTGALDPTTFVTPYGSYQPAASRFSPPSGANQPTTFVTPSGPTTSVTPYGPYQHVTSRPPGANQSTTSVNPSGPTTFVTHSRGPNRNSLFNAAPSGPHLHASTSLPTLATQPHVQQMVWPTPRQTPVQHSQDGRLDEAEFNPY